MTPQSSRRVVLGSVAFMLATTTLTRAQAGKWPDGKAVIGGTIVGAGLSALSGTAPQLAASLAATAAVSTLILSTRPNKPHPLDALASALRKG